MMMVMSKKVVTIVLFCDFDMVARQMTQIGFYGSNIGVFNKAKIGSLWVGGWEVVYDPKKIFANFLDPKRKILHCAGPIQN